MRRYWSFLLLHFVGMAMAFALLLQLRLHGGAMFAIQWWPVLITGLLFASSCCLEANLPTCLQPDEEQLRRFSFLRRLPSDLSLKTSALVSFGLSPVWGWRNSAASLSFGLVRYFSFLQEVSLLAMFSMTLYFALHLRVLCACIGGSRSCVQRWTFGARGLLYLVLVPVFAVLAVAGRLWVQLLWPPTLENLQHLSQALEFQFMVGFHSWIGTVISWLALGMVAFQVYMSFVTLLLFNKFLDTKELCNNSPKEPPVAVATEENIEKPDEASNNGIDDE